MSLDSDHTTLKENRIQNIRIDISHIPFSRYGAYLSVTRNRTSDGKGVGLELSINTCRRRFEENTLFFITFGNNEDFECSASPDAVTVKTESGSAVIYLRDDDTLVIDSKGTDIVFRMHLKGYGTKTGERSYRIISENMSLFCSFEIPVGKVSAEGPYQKICDNVQRDRKTNLSVRCENGRSLIALNVRPKEPEEITLPIETEKDRSEIIAEWQDFLKLMPKKSTADENDFAVVTWFNLWSSFVRADDIYTSDTMVMSKKYMSSTWSWDHCFNSLVIAHLNNKETAKRYAMNQFNAPFVLQSQKGVLPDMWNPDLEIRWGTTKPPIHGWCFSKLMDEFDFTYDELEKSYKYLEKWTNWWLKYSDTDGDGIPDYPQGCDSGWDNSTLFDIGYFLETPDLPAFLILQMKTLARICDALHNEEKKIFWLNEAEALLARFIEHSWNGERFVAKVSGSHESDEHPTSLLSLMPLVLGDILPKSISDTLVRVLEQDFLTENGFATEMPTSAKYDSDGYWRGPIWAPTTYLLIDGLRRGGYNKLAETAAKRYCNMSRFKAKGNYENFDALTGLGRRAPGYTWAASVYMLLHLEYESE